MFMDIFVVITYPKFLIEDLVCEFVVSIGKRSVKIVSLISKFY